MSYLDKHLGYMNAEGNSIAESQFNTTANFINSHFADSPFYKVVKVNGTIDLEVQLQDVSVVTRNSNISLVENLLKFILLKPNTSVNIGDMIEFDNLSWIVTDSISDNPLFPKAKIEKCNFVLPLKTGETKTLKGYDGLKRPVYDIQPTFTNVQCLLRTTVTTIGLNQPINLPQGQVNLTVQYNDTSKAIKENDEFEIYNRQYKVIGFDFTNIVQGVGCLVIIAERVVNT